MKNNTYRVFAFSEDVISIYNESNKCTTCIENNSMDFDSVTMLLFKDKSLELTYFKDGFFIGRSSVLKYGYYPKFLYPIEFIGTIQPEQKEEPLFHAGDRVFDWAYQWCIITQVRPHGTIFFVKENETKKGYSFSGEQLKRLSFAEYNFIDGGWSQERPKPLPKVGDIGYFWGDNIDLEEKSIIYGELKNIDLSHKTHRYYIEDKWFKYFSTEKPF